jgi:glycerol uptake facilitator-like aquaporin
MKKCLKVLKFVYFFSCFFVLLGNTSFAYIDPSAVTYVIQAVAGACIATGAAFTVYRHKIMKFFRNMKKKQAKKKKENNKDNM